MLLVAEALRVKHIERIVGKLLPAAVLAVCGSAEKVIVACACEFAVVAAVFAAGVNPRQRKLAVRILAPVARSTTVGAPVSVQEYAR